jgi:hypothetical protein
MRIRLRTTELGLTYYTTVVVSLATADGDRKHHRECESLIHTTILKCVMVISSTARLQFKASFTWE